MTDIIWGVTVGIMYALGLRWGYRSGDIDGYIRGYRDGTHGRTFKRQQETY